MVLVVLVVLEVLDGGGGAERGQREHGDGRPAQHVLCCSTLALDSTGTFVYLVLRGKARAGGLTQHPACIHGRCCTLRLRGATCVEYCTCVYTRICNPRV